MNDDAWEQRMAQRALERASKRPPEPDPHAGHHLHLAGTSVCCSCGEERGVITVVFDESAPPPRCRICGKHGVVAIGGNDQLCPDTDHHGSFGCTTCGYRPLTEERRDE